MKKLVIVISVLTVMLLCSIQVSAISGEGTEESPYLIENSDDFLMMGYFPSRHFKLMSDISVDTTLEAFAGILDGNSFKITTTKEYVFLSNSGNIMNLSISGGNIAVTNGNEGKIDNCCASNTELVITNNGIISECKSDYTGAVVKHNNGTIRACVSAMGYIAVDNNSEGIISKCSDCLHIADRNLGLIEACSTIGGIFVSENSGIITNSFSINSHFVSSNKGTIKMCYTTGTKSIDESTSFVVSNSGTIDLCYSNLNIYHRDRQPQTEKRYIFFRVGGLVGSNSGTISRSYYDGEIYCDMMISSSIENGSYDCYVGGIVGSNSGTVKASYTKGKIRAIFEVTSNSFYKHLYPCLYVGGIASQGGKIENCYSSMYINATTNEGNSRVTFTEDAFGIAGNSQIKNCYYSGGEMLIDGTYVRASSTSIGTYYDSVKFSRTKIGCGDGTIENSYYLSERPFEDDITCGKPLSTSAMKMQVFYTDWDFDGVWAINSEMNDGYPYLQWQPIEEKPEIVINVESITLDKEEIKLNINETVALIATITPDNATNKNIMWSSSNTDVVTVENGVINAVGEGTATIIVKTEDGGHIALCSVEVSEIMINESELNINNYIKTEDSVAFDINLVSPSDLTGTVIVALYNKDYTLATTKTYKPASEINVLMDFSESQYIKVMWWDMDTLVPVTECKQIEL